MQLLRPVKTRFPYGSGALHLNLAAYSNSPARSTKSTRSHVTAPTACKHRVSGTLSLPSRGTFHLSLTVLFAIGHQVVFSLGGWSPRFPTGFLVSCGTLDTAVYDQFSCTGLSPSLAGLSRTVPLTSHNHVCSPNPEVHAPRFGLFPFRSPLL